MLKNILTLSFLLIIIANFAITSIVKSDLVSRHRRQDGLPDGFKCDLCNRCSAPCSEECNKCAGCDLMKILPASQRQAFGDVSQCETFCKGGIAGCVKTCRFCQLLNGRHLGMCLNVKLSAKVE